MTQIIHPVSDLEVHIPRVIYQKVLYWVQKVDYEISGLGTVKEVDGTLVIQDAILLEQTGSEAETEISGEAIAKAMYELRDSEGELQWWWHSHHKMKAFWSGTDRATISQLGRTAEWFIATVFNHAEGQQTAYIQAKPVPLMIDTVDLYITDPEITDDMLKNWDAEFEKNVKRAAPVYRPQTKKFEHTWPSKDDNDWPPPRISEPQPPKWKKWKCPECGSENYESVAFEYGEIIHCDGCTTQFFVDEHPELERRYILEKIDDDDVTKEISNALDEVVGVALPDTEQVPLEVYERDENAVPESYDAQEGREMS